MPISSNFSGLTSRSYGMFGNSKDNWLVTTPGDTETGPSYSLNIAQKPYGTTTEDHYLVIGSNAGNFSSGYDAMITTFDSRGKFVSGRLYDVDVPTGYEYSSSLFREGALHTSSFPSANNAYFSGSLNLTGGSVFGYDMYTEVINWHSKLQYGSYIVGVKSLLQPPAMSESIKNKLIVVGSYEDSSTYYRSSLVLLNTETGLVDSQVRMSISNLDLEIEDICWVSEGSSDKYYAVGASGGYEGSSKAILWKRQSDVLSQDWVRAYGSTGARFNSVYVDNTGVYCAGWADWVDGGSLYKDFYDPVLVKFNSSGTFQWAVSYDSSINNNGDQGYKKVIGDGVYLYTITGRNIHKFDVNGNLIWQRLLTDSGYENQDIQLYDIKINSKGQLVVLGVLENNDRHMLCTLPADGTEVEVAVPGINPMGILFTESYGTPNTVPQATAAIPSITSSTAAIVTSSNSDLPEFATVDDFYGENTFRTYRY